MCHIKTNLIDATAIVTGTLVAGVISTTEITTGKLNVTTGATIGGFKVDGDKLSSLNQNGAILIEENGVHFLRINEYGMRLPEAPLLTIRNDKGAAISLSGGNNKTVLSISGNGAKNAIDSSGNHVFNQRAGETWSAPGALWAGIVNEYGVCVNSWGNGCTMTVSRNDTGSYVFRHNLNHVQYYIFATSVFQNWGLCTITDQTTTYFVIRTFHKDSGWINHTFHVVVIGRPTIK